MRSDLVPMTKRLEEQLGRLENELRDNVRKVRKMESQALIGLGRARKRLSSLSASPDWMAELLHIIDVLGDIERFINKVNSIESANIEMEEVSLESLMECDASVPF